MATDLAALVARLRAFKDPAGLDVLAVGCGGGQLASYLAGARSIIALDIDGEALQRFAAALSVLGAPAPCRMIEGPLEAWDGRVDLAFFEFCLHEMQDPDGALAYAGKRASYILVADHYPGSIWALCTGEGEKVERAWKAAAVRKPSSLEIVDAVQVFRDFDELEGRVASQGEPALNYIQRYRDKRDLLIPMRWAMALFQGTEVNSEGKENR